MKHDIKKKYLSLSIEEENILAQQNGWDLYDGKYPELERLYNADENCRHMVKSAVGGGCECVKCGGWFCY